MREPAVIGNFRVLRQLGSGGMGTVYEALNEAIERRVAIKVLRPEYASNQEFVTRFFNEARAVNRIEHPSLVQISEYGQTADGSAYIVMEYLRGETLTARLQRFHARGEQQPLTQTLQTAWQLADALAAAHDKGIVHRDLKPDNVILVADPVAPGGERAKLLDFGIAKLVQSNVDHTGTLVIMGTPSYMSPEQCRGAGEVNDRSDVYSLGTIIYQMVAGRVPFLGAGSGDLIGQHLYVEPPQLGSLAPRTPPQLVALVHQLLIKDKAQRPPMREVLGELRRLLDGAAASLSQAAKIVAPAASGPGHFASPAVVTLSTLGRLSGEHGRAPRSKQQRAVAAGALFCLLVAGLVGGKLAWQRHGTMRSGLPGRDHTAAPVLRATNPALIALPTATPAQPSVPSAPAAGLPSRQLAAEQPVSIPRPQDNPGHKEAQADRAHLPQPQGATPRTLNAAVLRKSALPGRAEAPTKPPAKVLTVASAKPVSEQTSNLRKPETTANKPQPADKNRARSLEYEE